MTFISGSVGTYNLAWHDVDRHENGGTERRNEKKFWKCMPHKLSNPCLIWLQSPWDNSESEELTAALQPAPENCESIDFVLLVTNTVGVYIVWLIGYGGTLWLNVESSVGEHHWIGDSLQWLVYWGNGKWHFVEPLRQLRPNAVSFGVQEGFLFQIHTDCTTGVRGHFYALSCSQYCEKCFSIWCAALSFGNQSILK
jgi:hypothetical protein